jgi:hypothetical protein
MWFPPSSRTRNWYEVLFEDPARFATGSSDALKRESPGLNLCEATRCPTFGALVRSRTKVQNCTIRVRSPTKTGLPFTIACRSLGAGG